MKFQNSKKTGIKAELNLINDLKNDRNKRLYVISKLNKFSTIQNQYIKSIKDIKILKYALETNLKEQYANLKDSKLNQDEINLMRNALHTRYMNCIRKHKIPLHKG
jgi:hypothetical protein